MSASSGTPGPAAGERPVSLPPPRRLLLMRHAKSGYPGGVTDHDRPLAPRGILDAAAAGAWIATTEPPVDLVLCSDARRARETAAHTGIEAPARYDARLYGAGTAEFTEVLSEVAASVTVVLVVAHSPGIGAFAGALAGDGSDADALAGLREGFPTAAVAVLDVPVGWDRLRPGTCRLVRRHVPRA